MEMALKRREPFKCMVKKNRHKMLFYVFLPAFRINVTIVRIFFNFFFGCFVVGFPNHLK